MVRIPSGRFRMGSRHGYPEEREEHEASVGAFWIDRHEVTNAQFARFVDATGYVTRAEHAPRTSDLPDVPADRLQPGSAVFVPPRGAEHLGDGAYAWWRWMPGANWRHPQGPSSDIVGRENHPVVHVAYDDALAYARWLKRDLPTEAQWEYAARGGLDGADYPWGNTPDAQGRSPAGTTVADRLPANTWQGRFPFTDSGRDGHVGTAPVGCYPANGFGLYDAVGNVWEWTRDTYRTRHPASPGVEPTVASLSATGTGDTARTRVIKGGSFLCAPDYCVRYRPSARQPQDALLGTVHVGFRTVLNIPD